MKTKFDTDVNKAKYHTDWRLITYFTWKKEKISIEKTNLKVMQVLLNRLQLCPRALELGYIGENKLIPTIQSVCSGVPERKFALFTSPTIFEELFSKLQSSIMTHDNRNAAKILDFTSRQFRRHDSWDLYNKGNNTYNHYNNNHNDRKPCR